MINDIYYVLLYIRYFRLREKKTFQRHHDLQRYYVQQCVGRYIDIGRYDLRGDVSLYKVLYRIILNSL